MAIIYTTGDGRQFIVPDGTQLAINVTLFDSLITNRTQQDVERWRELHDKGWLRMTTDEKAEWLGRMKGRYSYADMNRVETAVKNLSDRFVINGYLTTPLSVKTDWSYADVPTRDDMERYLGNVATLRNVMFVYPTTPKAPTIDQPMDYTMANDIEKILFDVNDILTKIPQSWRYAGEIYSGED